jgi:hypothetical protein
LENEEKRIRIRRLNKTVNRYLHPPKRRQNNPDPETILKIDISTLDNVNKTLRMKTLEKKLNIYLSSEKAKCHRKRTGHLSPILA